MSNSTIAAVHSTALFDRFTDSIKKLSNQGEEFAKVNYWTTPDNSQDKDQDHIDIKNHMIALTVDAIDSEVTRTLDAYQESDNSVKAVAYGILELAHFISEETEKPEPNYGSIAVYFCEVADELERTFESDKEINERLSELNAY